MNSYYEKIQFVKEKVVDYLIRIYQDYGNELSLKLGECNLLQSEFNCIQSSTAIGYCMEEFIVSKLEAYTKNHNNFDFI